MRKSKFSESEIVAILKEGEAGLAVQQARTRARARAAAGGQAG